jgi:hypothetical protein
MMVERIFLSALTSFLTDNLPAAPALLGTAEPTRTNELPAVVLSLEKLRRPGTGLGERSALITDSTLLWSAAIDLANPVLPEEPTFSLISEDRRTLILPHGGLVRADGSAGPLSAADFAVTVAGQARTLVSGTPGANQVQVDPLVGRMVFGAALPLSGAVVANYILGQWEQRVARLDGSLTIAVFASAVGPLETLTDHVIAAFTDKQLAGLERISLSELKSIGRPDTGLNNARSRTMTFEFEYEAVINRPDSSGGIIQSIPLTTLLQGGA